MIFSSQKQKKSELERPELCQYGHPQLQYLNYLEISACAFPMQLKKEN